jgi:hypothetical protein
MLIYEGTVVFQVARRVINFHQPLVRGIRRHGRGANEQTEKNES